MSLEMFQHQWMQLMFAKDLEDSQLENLVHKTIFKGISIDKLKTIAATVEEGKISVLCAVLPASLKRHISEKEQHSLAKAYASCFPHATISPAAQAIPMWLDWLSQQPKIKAVPLLEDLINYEKACLSLRYYQLPQMPRLTHEKLAPWATLFVAHASFPEMLKELPELALPLDAQKNQGWLVYQDKNDYKYQPLHWAIYGVLETLDGLHSYSKGVEALCKAHSELFEQREMFGNWYNWLKNENLLTLY